MNDIFRKFFRAKDAVALFVQHERSTIKNKVVLPASLVDVDKGKSGFFDPLLRNSQALLRLADFKGAGIGSHQNIRPLVFQVAGNVRVPQILADHHADAVSAKKDRIGEGALLESSRFIENAIIG